MKVSTVLCQCVNCYNFKQKAQGPHRSQEKFPSNGPHRSRETFPSNGQHGSHKKQFQAIKSLRKAMIIQGHLTKVVITFQFESPIPKSLVEIGLGVTMKIFKCPQCIIAIISPWKRAWPFILTNLNSLYLRMLCAMWLWRSKESFTDRRMDRMMIGNKKS